MKYSAVLSLTFFLPFCFPQSLWVDFPAWSPVGAIGVWDGDSEQVAAVNTKAEPGISYLGPWPFAYDGETVTLLLVPLKTWEDQGDNYYRLKAKWVGQDLYYLLPVGAWQHVATFRDGRFEIEDFGVRWKYKRVVGHQLKHDYYRPLVKERQKHDYTQVRWFDRNPVHDLLPPEGLQLNHE